MTNLTEQLIKEKKDLEKRNFGLHKLISELNEENAQLKKQLMASNNWVKAFYAYEKSNFVRRKVAAHIKEVEKIMRELNK